MDVYFCRYICCYYVIYLAMSELAVYIQSYFGIEKQYLDAISELFELEEIEKGNEFARIGKPCQKLSFIKSGHFRIYNYHNGKEITQYISSSGEFIADLSSLTFKGAARWNIDALTNAELYTINAKNYQQINELVPQWDRLEKLFIAKCFLTLEDRVFSFLSMTAEERYKQLLKLKPDLFYSVPLNYIASMLGMTPETFSRLRQKRIS